MARPNLQELNRLDEAAWPAFRDGVLAAETFEELQAFLASALPRPDGPGRRYFSALLFFLSALRRPGGASDKEWALYQRLAERMVERGEWKPDALKPFQGAKDE